MFLRSSRLDLSQHQQNTQELAGNGNSFNVQLLDEAEHDIKNYSGPSYCYLPKITRS